ncbi:MAG: hypothetical protein ACXVCP_05160 [Bdellovibrio sp.]
MTLVPDLIFNDQDHPQVDPKLCKELTIDLFPATEAAEKFGGPHFGKWKLDNGKWIWGLFFA